MSIGHNPTTDTTDRLAGAAHAAIDKAADSVKGAEKRAREVASDASDRLHETADRARTEGEKLAKSLKDYTGKHPVASLGIAFAAGVVIASLLRR